jgi:uncharacterized protein (UPF0333 family)
METTIALSAVSGAVCFVLGVVFGKQVVSEAEAIKAHVTAQVNEVRSDIVSGLAAAAKKL